LTHLLHTSLHSIFSQQRKRETIEVCVPHRDRSSIKDIQLPSHTTRIPYSRYLCPFWRRGKEEEEQALIPTVFYVRPPRYVDINLLFSALFGFITIVCYIFSVAAIMSFCLFV
jgi:hypothetical protein